MPPGTPPSDSRQDPRRVVGAEVGADLRPGVAAVRRAQQELRARVDHACCRAARCGAAWPTGSDTGSPCGALRPDVRLVAELLIDARVAAVLPRRVQPAAVGRIDLREHAVVVADGEPVPHRRRGRAGRSTGPSSARDPAGRRRCCTDPPCRRRSRRSRRPACSRSDRRCGRRRRRSRCRRRCRRSSDRDSPDRSRACGSRRTCAGRSRGAFQVRPPSSESAVAVLRDEDVLVVAGIDANLAEVVRTLRADVVVVGVHLRPRLRRRCPVR